MSVRHTNCAHHAPLVQASNMKTTLHQIGEERGEQMKKTISYLVLPHIMEPS